MRTFEFLIDHGNPETSQVYSKILYRYQRPPIVVDYEDSYLDTLRKISSMLSMDPELYIWVFSSICDYTYFDFRPPISVGNENHFHVYPSGNQEQGDTFFFKSDIYKKLILECKNLEYLGTVNYDKPSITRLRYPSFMTQGDTHTSSLRARFKFPYAVFKTEPIDAINDPSLWDKKNIIINSTGATSIMLPREASEKIKNELYDYPLILNGQYIERSRPLDIVFISNGESNAEENYARLLECVDGRGNRVARVEGITGRSQAYKQAAETSQTSWFFAVFAKLWVDKRFDWDWQPDRLQVPKHYIFDARNPVNGLVYGHQAVIAYNKNLVLYNPGTGLDFTLSDPHAAVEIISGEARFNTDPYNTWKTAFREVIKLRHDRSLISKSRLDSWCNIGIGSYSEWSKAGANDALRYYQEVNGDEEQLRLSYEWKWLREFFDEKYN